MHNEWAGIARVFMIASITGLIAGAVHVWSGPDHLAALAPLAARRAPPSWVLGVRWGLGHSAGVAIVGLVSLWLRDHLPVDLLSSWGERLVGIMLLGIGFWALRKACKVHVHEHEHEGDRHLHIHAHARRVCHDEPVAHQHSHAALGIGILHGLAGSSHFLGILPILAFPSHSQALAYLICFGLGTVGSMAAFSWTLGWLTTKCARHSTRIYRGLMAGCAALAVGVGCIWLVQ